MEQAKEAPKRGRPSKGGEPKYKTLQADVNKNFYELWMSLVKESGFTGSMYLRSVMVSHLIERGKISGWDEVKEKFGRTPKLPGK